MAVIQSGDSIDLLSVDPTFKSARVSPSPLDHGSQGAYSGGGFTGVLPAALGANSEIFQFRWTDATRFAVIRRVRVSSAVSTTFFAAGVPAQIDLVKATAWTVQGTGGTGVSPSTFFKRRTSMANTLVASGDIRVSTTAALGAGTKVLESSALVVLAASAPTAGPRGQIIPVGTVLWQADVGDGDHPLVLAANEGFVIRSVAVPATGTWMAAISVDWTEVSSF